MSMAPTGFLFLDVRVKRVEHRSEVRMIDAADVTGGLLHRVEEVRFESIERLDGATDAGLSGYGCDSPVDRGGVFEFGLARVFSRELRQHLIIRSAEGLRAGVVPALDDAFEVIDGSAAIRRVRGDRVVRFVREDGRGRASRPLSRIVRPTAEKCFGSLVSNIGISTPSNPTAFNLGKRA